MKILIVSDSHGHHDLVRKAIGQEAPIDMLIHAGDVEGDLEMILGKKRDYEIRAGGQIIYLTHGHRVGVHGGTYRLTERARHLGADIAIYGHTHVPDHGTENEVLVINPGSIAKPRQQGWKKTYAVMTIDSAGKVDVQFKNLPGRSFF